MLPEAEKFVSNHNELKNRELKNNQQKPQLKRPRENHIHVLHVRKERNKLIWMKILM